MPITFFPDPGVQMLGFKLEADLFLKVVIFAQEEDFLKGYSELSFANSLD